MTGTEILFWSLYYVGSSIGVILLSKHLIFKFEFEKFNAKIGFVVMAFFLNMMAVWLLLLVTILMYFIELLKWIFADRGKIDMLLDWVNQSKFNETVD